ncbi:MAG: glutathione S-transferase family protein [Bacteriovoracaceae bacterium]|nr:glutathione S-transferase family protein [Bacteriovoracaceae bacterium]
MGRLIDGKWHVADVITSDQKGAYARIPRSFLDTISSDHEKFKPESGRYHLFVSYACPWAHRTLIYRKLKGLEEHISVSVVSPDMLDQGWVFDPLYPEATREHLYGHDKLYKIYQKADPHVSTSVTVPVLWDKLHETIVNNESSQIIRIFNSNFNELTGNKENYYPESLQDEIDQLNELVYENVNNGVYRTGFAKTQEAYNEAVDQLFNTLDKLDKHLEAKTFLCGDILTEADLRLIPTLLRFDAVYFTHFKCNIRRICDYKNLSRYTSNLYEIPAIKETTNFDHIKRHYYYSHESINPFRIIPKGPAHLI